ncbi:MAG: hypothetical protein ASARMPRED_005784 [Alectoria sarmentosa]|nr:MAG: hypothetical protein ASARMPRED_005784 [Alectoria sarmentosa]
MKARTLALSALSLTVSIPLATAYSGDLTFYTPAFTPSGSSCAIAATAGEPIVAISHLMMNNGNNPNTNPLCGTTISIYNPYNQQTVPNVKIVDTCQGCDTESIDVNVQLFEALGFDPGLGRVQGVDWGGSAIGGKMKMKRGSGLEALGVGKVVERELGHPHGRREGA